MGKNTSFSLGEHFTSFIDEKVKEGRSGSASDVVRAGLRMLEEYKTRLTALRAALDEGEASGMPVLSTSGNSSPASTQRDASADTG